MSAISGFVLLRWSSSPILYAVTNANEDSQCSSSLCSSRFQHTQNKRKDPKNTTQLVYYIKRTFLDNYFNVVYLTYHLQSNIWFVRHLLLKLWKRVVYINWNCTLFCLMLPYLKSMNEKPQSRFRARFYLSLISSEILVWVITGKIFQIL